MLELIIGFVIGGVVVGGILFLLWFKAMLDMWSKW